MAFINSDDKYLPWAFHVVSSIFSDCPEVEWLTTGRMLEWNAEGVPATIKHSDGFARRLFYSGYYLSSHPAWCGMHIQQESTFWRRSLWEKAGAAVVSDYFLDFELWCRFWKCAPLYTVPVALGGFRIHSGSLSCQNPAGWNRGCHAVLASYREPGWGFWNLRLRRKACALLGRLRSVLAAPAKQVYYDHGARRWQTRTVRVI